MAQNNIRQSLQLQASQKKPNVVLEIDGLDFLLSVNDLYEVVTFDTGVPIFEGTTFGSKRVRNNVKKLISIDGTTSTLSQTVEPDKGTGTATSSITVRIVDVLQYATRLISPGVILSDILYRKCVFYVGLSEGIYPQDYVSVFSGVVTGIKSTPTFIDLVIAHPDEVKRTEIFIKGEAKLLEAVDYFSLVVGPLTLTQKSDYIGTVSIEIQNTGGAAGSISVSGGSIMVQALSGVTTYGRVKELIEGSIEASQLVTVQATGDRNETTVALSSTDLSSSSEILMDTVEGFLLPVSPLFETYVEIDDELIKYTAIDTVDKKLTGITRAQLNSIGKTHKKDASVKSFYVLGDESPTSSALELMKYILLSGGPEWFLEDISVSDIVSLPNGLSGPNALFFRSQFLKTRYGITNGDILEISDATNVSNDVTAEIQQIFEYETGTFIKVADTVSLVSEPSSPALARFKSGYNILPDGAGVTPSQLDIEQIEKVASRFSSGLARYKFYLKDTVKVKDFLEKELLFPSGLYSVPRLGKISVQYTAPAILDGNTKPLDADSVIDPQDTIVERGTGKFFYNSVVYKYEEDSITDSFLRGSVNVSADSFERIKAPTKAINIFSKGLRSSSATEFLILRNAFRLLSRYKFGSESLSAEVTFEVGCKLQVGDAVEFGDLSFPIPDTKTGLKKFAPRVFEIVNKELNWRDGAVRLKLVDTAFLGRRRYGLFSPSSRADTGSTTSKIVLRQFYNPSPELKEVFKWTNYLGRQILVRSTDRYDTSTNEVVTIIGFDASGEGSIFVAPSLTFTPTQSTIVQIPNYSGAGISDALMTEYKSRYVFFTPQVEIVSVVSDSVLDVGSDSAKFFVGSLIRVHNEDFTYDTGTTQHLVTAISGDEITVSPAILPGASTGDLIDLIGFVSDNGEAYAWL